MKDFPPPMATGRALLIVDDDDILRRALADQIAATGAFAQIAEADTGAAAFEHTTRQVFDLILLDIGLPDEDGRGVCRRLRNAGVRSPIIMLTAADSDDDTITGLNAGANDYVTKPFRM